MATLTVAGIGRLDRPLRRQVRPIEAEVRVRVLERLPHLGLESSASNLHVRGRAKKVQHARPLRPLAWPVRVHDVRTLVTALVARVPNEGHYLFFFPFVAAFGFPLLFPFAGLDALGFSVKGFTGLAAAFAAFAAGFSGAFGFGITGAGGFTSGLGLLGAAATRAAAAAIAGFWWTRIRSKPSIAGL